eukprot:scaffold33375_cov53-Phaeocystis_antarctica.AAC.3
MVGEVVGARRASLGGPYGAAKAHCCVAVDESRSSLAACCVSFYQSVCLSVCLSVSTHPSMTSPPRTSTHGGRGRVVGAVPPRTTTTSREESTPQRASAAPADGVPRPVRLRLDPEGRGGGRRPQGALPHLHAPESPGTLHSTWPHLLRGSTLCSC